MHTSLSEVDLRPLIPFIIIQVILFLVAIIDITRRGRQTKGPKLMWVFIVIFISIFGPVAYFIFGRRNDA